MGYQTDPLVPLKTSGIVPAFILAITSSLATSSLSHVRQPLQEEQREDDAWRHIYVYKRLSYDIVHVSSVNLTYCLPSIAVPNARRSLGTLEGRSPNLDSRYGLWGIKQILWLHCWLH